MTQGNQISFGFDNPEASPGVAFDALKEQARACRNCHLWEPATQTVFGEGPVPAPVMMIGEQPGDKEDLAGKPFVGPAGKKLNQALHEAGLDRSQLYITNAVKHFKFVPRGKIRLHQKPVTTEIKACHFWIDKEIELVKPKLIVALGATAAQSLFGKAMPVNKNRGRLIDLTASHALITIHPSFLLRIEDPHQAEGEYNQFVADLALAKSFFL